MPVPKGFKHTKESREKLSQTWKERGHPRGMKGKHHSEETKLKMSLSRSGERNGRWKGGITQIIRGIRHTKEYSHWRKSVIVRDGRCVDCKSTENLDAHHIRQIIDYPELIFDIDNGLTLCEECHKRHSFWQKIKPGKRGKKK